MAARETGMSGNTDTIGPKDGMSGPDNRRHVARLVLVPFVITFSVSRILVFLIMNRTLPDLFIYVGGTHVHHLNQGIFLLSGVGAYLLFVRPKGRKAEWTAVLYGIGLALTFDEFGMWLHLGGGYWQRASYDAVTVLAGLLLLLAFAPSPKEFRGSHKITILIILLVGAGFFFMLFWTLNRSRGKVAPPYRKAGKDPAGTLGVGPRAGLNLRLTDHLSGHLVALRTE
jgi:hypothetical protein